MDFRLLCQETQETPKLVILSLILLLLPIGIDLSTLDFNFSAVLQNIYNKK